MPEIIEITGPAAAKTPTEARINCCIPGSNPSHLSIKPTTVSLNVAITSFKAGMTASAILYPSNCMLFNAILKLSTGSKVAV